MKSIKALILLLFVVWQHFVVAQQQPVYSFQKDDTLLKKSWAEESVKKKSALIASLEKKTASDYKKIYEDQFGEIAEIWNGTRSVTSTEAHNYLQSLVKRIIAANPELKGIDARVVFSRDWWPNAFSMGDGTIVINAGLVIYMSSEAELAFVLGHELAHYYLEHTPKAIKKYIETINSEAYQAELKRLSKETYRVNQQVEQFAKNVVFKSHRHRRDNESESDRYAFMFMKRAGYNVEAIRTCLQLLDKVDDSLFQQPVQVQTVFNFEAYPFKTKWIQKTSAIFAQLNEDNSPLTEKEKDSLKTHPDCSKRIEMLADSISATGNSGKFYFVDEAGFKKLKKDFVVEMTEQCHRDKNLSRNLYYSLLLLQIEEYKPFAIYSIARCLNEIYVAQKDHKLGLMVDVEHKGNSDSYNLLLRMLNRLRLDEIANINYQFCSQYRATMRGYAGFEDEGRKAQTYKN